ncbi:MAG TPA: Gfo/Idh/MocA family oxidoreductase [Chloroflexota bacterium]|nr:Gfo/Idh/MocA family oxidoreductase [Chloroflexota bacterium]
MATQRWAPDPVVGDGEPGKGMRLAVAGASHWHLPRHAAFLREAGARFVAVSDPDPAVAAKWAADLGASPVADAEAIVRAKPDAVLALGRVADMAAQARILLDAGLPLIAEKPLGLDPADVQQVAALAAQKRAWVSVALVQRYDPIWTLLDRLRDEGTLGDVAHAHVRIVNGPPQRYAAWGSGWMLDPATAGGGALLNLGIHGMDYLRHLAGGALQVTGAIASSRAHRLAIEDFGAATLRSSSGFAGTVEAGYTYPDAAAGMTRSGDNETRVAAQGAYLIGRDAELTLVTAAGEQAVEGGRQGDRYRDWAFDSLARLRAGRPPAATVEDCLEAVRLVFAAYAAASQPPR